MTDIGNPRYQYQKERAAPGIEGAAIPVMVRVPPALLKAIDEWSEGDISRPESIRQLISHALIPKAGAISISAELTAAVNRWAANTEPGLSLPEAILQLVEFGLKAKGKM